MNADQLRRSYNNVLTLLRTTNDSQEHRDGYIMALLLEMLLWIEENEKRLIEFEKASVLVMEMRNDLRLLLNRLDHVGPRLG